MKQQIGRLLSTLLLATFSLGITAGVIQGTIIDKQTKEPLTGATVQIAGTTTGTVADVDGNYTLTLSNGTYTIEVKYIGYKTLRMNEVKVVYEGQDISIYELLPAEHFFLQPCSCNNTALTVDCVMRHPKWRLSLQTHKLIDIR